MVIQKFFSIPPTTSANPYLNLVASYSDQDSLKIIDAAIGNTFVDQMANLTATEVRDMKNKALAKAEVLRALEQQK